MPTPDAKTPSAKPRRAKEDPELAALYTRVGTRILQVRESMGASQREACLAVFGSFSKQGNWSRWERGTTLPTIATLYQVATWGGVSLGGLGLFEPREEVSAVDIARAREHLDAARKLLGGEE